MLSKNVINSCSNNSPHHPQQHPHTVLLFFYSIYRFCRRAVEYSCPLCQLAPQSHWGTLSKNSSITPTCSRISPSSTLTRCYFFLAHLLHISLQIYYKTKHNILKIIKNQAHILSYQKNFVPLWRIIIW